MADPLVVESSAGRSSGTRRQPRLIHSELDQLHERSGVPVEHCAPSPAMAHNGSGIVLKTSFDRKGNRVLRTIFDKRYVTYQTITDYVPPLFLVVNYEQTVTDRDCFFKTKPCGKPTATADTTVLKTDDVFCDNVRFVESLLVSADCGYDAFQVTFLRLEIAGDFQRSFDKHYPLWNVGVGALVRLSFATWPTRSRALKVLASNAANNQDVYTINFAANTSAVTIVDYLEPLFAYCAKKTINDGHDTEFCTRPSGGAKRASYVAAANTTEMFEINFRIIDEPPIGYPKSIIDDWSGIRRGASAAGGSVAGSIVSKGSTGGKRKREAVAAVGTANTAAAATGDIGRQQSNVESDADWLVKTVRRRDSAVLEKHRTLCGSLSVHDVRPYFAMLQSKRLTRISIDQLEELPVVTIRCEPCFCATTCRVLDRTDNQPTVLHIYYCWQRDVHEFLSAFADACNQRQKQTTRSMVAVSPLCTEDVEARLDMLRDLKNVIWKDNINAYIRLAIGESHDNEMLARNFYEPLVLRVQRATADLETEIKRSVTSSMTSGSRDVFRNAISLDCSRLCNALDGKTCAFAATHEAFLNDSVFTTNGAIRIDRHTLVSGAASRQNANRLLERGQNYCTRLVSDFCSEQILDAAFEMATELRLGLLDVFGLKYTEQHRQQNASTRSGADEAVLDSLRAANVVFMDALTTSSTYTGNCGSVSSCNAFFSRERNVKPLLRSVRGLYKQDMFEFDLKSAYPTVMVLYNISPETTAIVERDALKRRDDALIGIVINDASRSQQAMLNANVMTSFYNQIGLLNEDSSNMVIVSLRREIYAGFLPRLMERLVLTRKNHNRLLNQFYKRLANVVYGCTGRANAFNDLFSPQCASAVRSMCRSVMSRTLQNVPQEHVVLTQTDGALLHAGDRRTTTCKQMESIVRASLDAVSSDIGNANVVSLPLEIRVRDVSMCLVIDHNRYLVLYNDGKTECKGQDGQPSYGDARAKEVLYSAITAYAVEHLDAVASTNVAVELNKFMSFCFQRLDAFNSEIRPDWFLTVTVPTAYESMFSVASQELLIGLPFDGFSDDRCLKRLADTSVVRFGDTAVVWPVLVNENGEVSTEFRVIRPSQNVAVKPNHVFVMKNLLWYWVKWLFAVCYPNVDEVNLKSMFHAICKKEERDLMATSNVG